MTVLAVGVVATVAIADAAAPVVAAAAGAGIDFGYVTTAVSGTAATAAAVAGSAGAGAAAGAIAGAGVASLVGAPVATVMDAASTGAAVGGAAAAAVTSLSAGYYGLVSNLVASPIGWILLGASTVPTAQICTTCTFNCWKPILHDGSLEPSNGMLIRDIIQDPRIKEATCTSKSSGGSLPNIVLTNIWQESFQIEFFTLPSAEIVAHAVPVNSL